MGPDGFRSSRRTPTRARTTRTSTRDRLRRRLRNADLAAGAGVVVASGQPLLPWDIGFGVVVDHGGGIKTWYWHMQPQVVVSPGTIVTSDSVIGYEGTTGLSTGCHVHFAVDHNGVGEPAQLPA